MSFLKGIGFFVVRFLFFDLIVLFVIIIVFINTFCWRSVEVHDDSMQPTFQFDDKVVVSDLFCEPKSFDVVAINMGGSVDKIIIRRIIASPGQTVRIDDEGAVFVDDVKLNELYLRKGMKTSRKNLTDKLFTIPKGYFFVLGDDRSNSNDSRNFGFIRCDQILGNVLFRVFKFDFFYKKNV